jgi:FkbM family methyltransferase
MNSFGVRVIKKLGWLKSINTTVKKLFNGKRVYIPLINGLGYENLSTSEDWMYVVLSKLLPLFKGAFIDIGVNVGQTLIKLKTVNRDIEWIGFEPNPKCIYYSLELIRSNDFQNCRLIPVGIFNRDDILELEFYSDSDTDPSASVIQNFRPDEKVFERIIIPVTTFEKANAALHINGVAVIKIDVEGAEPEVLESLQSVINQYRPLLMMEILPCYTSNNDQRIKRQQSIEAILFGLSYKIFRIVKRNLREFVKFESIESIGIHDNLDMCEYVMVPLEIADKI